MTCITLDTLQTVYDDGNRYYEAGTDLVDEIFDADESAFENTAIMEKAIWWRWREYVLGNCDTEAWVRAMADRLALVGSKWDEIISKSIAEDVELASIVDRAYRRELKRQPIEGTEGDVRTLSHVGSDVVENEHETLPQTATNDTKYLDAREKTTSRPGVTDTDKYAPNNKETETYEADDTLTALTFSEMIRNYPDVLIGFADEFGDYFVKRWYA